MLNKVDKKISDFSAGDFVSFKKIFQIKDDYSKFKILSGDKNPLHFDKEYSEASSFLKPIVPMHLSTMPLSRIAGMIFPGHRSLYLSTKIDSIQPIYYEDEIEYSAKIVSKSDATKTLIVNTILFKDKTVYLEAEQLIKVRNDDIPFELLPNMREEITVQKVVPTVLITGASGEIGKSIAMAFAKKGFHLVLHYNKNKQSIEALKEQCRTYGIQVKSIESDLINSKDRKNLLSAIQDSNITHFVHAASSSLHSDIQSLISSNYIALKEITEQLIVKMLRMQFGNIILIGSSAMQSYPKQWEDYIAAKSSAVSYINVINKHFKKYGIKASTLAPGFVGTSFSEHVRTKEDDYMLPEQVAESLLNIVENNASENYYWSENNTILDGSYGYYKSENKRSYSPENKLETVKFTQLNSDTTKDRLDTITKIFFNLDSTHQLDDIRFDQLNHWNSLKHIQYLLEIEKNFNVMFHSKMIGQTTTYKDLLVSLTQLAAAN